MTCNTRNIRQHELVFTGVFSIHTVQDPGYVVRIKARVRRGGWRLENRNELEGW